MKAILVHEKGDNMEMREKILKALENVHDPEIHKSLVELGMIGDIVVKGDSVLVNVILTTPKCPLKSTIGNDVKREVQRIEGISMVEVVFGEMDKSQKEALIAKLHGKKPEENLLGSVKMIAVGSGKGGVGKSSVTAGLAIALSGMGKRVGLIDADILGYSIPQIMEIKDIKPVVIEEKMIMPIEKNGVKIISMGNFVEKDEAFIWRGPMLGQVLDQFINDVFWGDLDYLLIDMPPGTGDMPLNIMQRIPGIHILIVTTPQVFAAGVAKRLGLMAKKTDCRIIGVVENMSYFICDNCDKKHYIFGKGITENLCMELDTKLLGKIPLISMEEGLKFKGENSMMGDAFKEIAGNLTKNYS